MKTPKPKSKAKAKNKPFSHWLQEEVSIEFGLARLKSHVFIEEIERVEPTPEQLAHPEIEKLKNILSEYVDTWNEDELRTMFISPFVSLVHFVSPYYKVFTQRPLSVNYAGGTKTTEGLVEFMLAKGYQIPSKPHFFMHEYKPEKRRDNDPCGQLLIAMVASRQTNADAQPVYGLYVVGRSWFFVVLDHTGYAISKSYSTEDEEIYKVFAILTHIKALMESLYQKN